MSDNKTPHIFSHRYEILQPLGEGGVGKVYRAYDRWIKKEVALKVLAADAENPSLLQNFKREYLLLAQLNHPGVVEVLDFGYSDNPASPGKLLPYFTMEFVEGKILKQVFPHLLDPRQAPQEFAGLYRLIWQICDVLEFLHLRGMVHCDLKPDNLKITDKSYGPKILDFGLCEKIGSKRGKETKGTLSYMAPEMFRDEALDERSDLYSLGIILYELVTSKLPFSYDDPVKIVSAHLQQKPVPPSKLNPHLPCSLNELILKLLEKSPADRPANATQVKETIEAGLGEDLKKDKKQRLWGEQNLFAHLYSGSSMGREKELSQLEDHLKRAIYSEGNCLLVSGELGVGKTRLFGDLKTICQLRGIIFVDSHCLENQTIAYQPLIEILHKLKPYAENNCADHIFTHLKEVLGWSRSDPTTYTETKTSFHQRISDLLVEISQSFAFAVIIENLQWADSSTLQFLEHLQRRKNKGRLLLCGSWREENSKENVRPASLLGSFLKHEDEAYLKLRRFDPSETRKLIHSKFIQGKFPDSFFNYVYRRTSGNPFFIMEVLKYLIEENIIFLKDSVWRVDVDKLEESKIPDSIEAVLLKNLQRYDDKTIDFLNTVAVIGKRFTLRLLGELYLLDQTTIWEIVTSLTRDQILTKKEDSGENETYYEFANQSLQNLLYQRLDQAKRTDLHKEVGELLERIGSKEEESVFDIAFHYQEGKEFDKAYRYALLSSEKMKQRFANDEVLRYLANAMEAASQLPHQKEASEKQIVALRQRADFCKRVGFLNQAEKDYLQILNSIRDLSDFKLLVEIYNSLGETYRLKHDYKKGISYLQEAMNIHQRLNDPAELASTLIYMGLNYWIDSQYDNALESFQKALKIYRKKGNELYVGNTLNNMGLVYWSRHQYSQALKYFREALSVYRDLDNKGWIARSLNNVGQTYFCLGEYAEAIRHYQESLEINEKIKNRKEQTFNLENLSEVHRQIGNYSDAIKYGQKGLKIASEIDFTERVGRILKDLGVIHFELGDYQKSYRYLQEASTMAERIEDKELQVLVRIALIRFYSVLNDEESCVRLLEEVYALANALGDEKSRISIFQIKSQLKKKEEALEEALKLLNQAMNLAQKLNVGEEIFRLNLEYAELHLERGDLDKSREFLHRAKKSGLERYILLQPLFHLISGRINWKMGDSKTGKEDFKTALSLAGKLNQSETIWQIHHLMGRLFLSSHNIEGAYQQLKNAGRVLKGLSESIEDEKLRESYLRDPKKRELLSDLKAVAKELIGETKLV